MHNSKLIQQNKVNKNQKQNEEEKQKNRRMITKYRNILCMGISSKQNTKTNMYDIL